MRRILLALLVWMAAAGACAAAPVFREGPCAGDGLEGAARCGIVSVPEDRGRPEGRWIDLNVIVLPALPGPPAAPQFDLEGGPGLPATIGYRFYLTDGAAYRRGRDIVLIDQRGAGASNPLRCTNLESPDRPAPLYDPKGVSVCARDLAGKADVRFYTTRDMAADTEDVRLALGYPQIDLFAISYGTTLALRYMAAYPGRVRTAVLWSAVPASGRPPREHATAAQAALEMLVRDCAADPACARAYPDIPGELRQATARLRGSRDPVTPGMFTERLRSLMYTPGGARQVPYIIHRAAAGDLAPFRATYGGGESAADGLYLSVTCTESFGHFSYAAALRAARRTVFGPYRLERQQAACRRWPKGGLAPGHFEPVRTDRPVLLISGEMDPVSPPAWAAEAARTLPNSRQVIVPHGGHLLDGMEGADECLDSVVLAFYAAGSAAGLDTACLTALKPPPFKLPA